MYGATTLIRKQFCCWNHLEQFPELNVLYQLETFLASIALSTPGLGLAQKVFKQNKTKQNNIVNHLTMLAKLSGADPAKSRCLNTFTNLALRQWFTAILLQINQCNSPWKQCSCTGVYSCTSFMFPPLQSKPAHKNANRTVLIEMWPLWSREALIQTSRKQPFRPEIHVLLVQPSPLFDFCCYWC